MKQNKRQVNFLCIDYVLSKNKCVYRVDRNCEDPQNYDCRYCGKDGYCSSAVAQVNAMMLELKNVMEKKQEDGLDMGRGGGILGVMFFNEAVQGSS